MRLALLAAAALAATPLAATPLAAQENYEIQVYPSRTADRRTTLFELHSNFTGAGTTALTDGILPTDGALHETLEITHGFSDVFEVGFYVFTSVNRGSGPAFVGTHIRPRVRAPDSWKLPVGLSLSTEFGPTNGKFDKNEWGIEVRPIVDQERGNFYWAFNPSVAWALKGPDAGRGVDGMTFNPNVKLAWKVDPTYAIGAEYYGTTGSLTRMAPAAGQDHMVYPTVDFFLSPDYELNIGYGVRVSGSGDHNILKVIFGRRVSW